MMKDRKARSFWEGVSDAFSFIMMLVVFMMIAVILAACSGPGLNRSVTSLPATSRSDVVAEMNRYRSEHGIQMVTTSKQLGPLADYRAKSAWAWRKGPLAKGHAYFEADVNASGVSGVWFGENLFAIDGYPTAREVVTGWHDSPTHRALMRRRTTTECNASQVTDGNRYLVALICSDQFNKEQATW